MGWQLENSFCESYSRRKVSVSGMIAGAWVQKLKLMAVEYEFST